MYSDEFEKDLFAMGYTILPTLGYPFDAIVTPADAFLEKLKTLNTPSQNLNVAATGATDPLVVTKYGGNFNNSQTYLRIVGYR